MLLKCKIGRRKRNASKILPVVSFLKSKKSVKLKSNLLIVMRKNLRKNIMLTPTRWRLKNLLKNLTMPTIFFSSTILKKNNFILKDNNSARQSQKRRYNSKKMKLPLTKGELWSLSREKEWELRMRNKTKKKLQKNPKIILTLRKNLKVILLLFSWSPSNQRIWRHLQIVSCWWWCSP